MTSGLLDLRNPDNWSLAYSVSLVAAPARSVRNGYIPIPPFQIPLLFTSPILMTDTEAADAAPGWWLGGTLRQKVDGPFIGSADLFAQRRKIPVNRTSLIRFPKLTADYNLEWQPVPWLREIRLQILEYIGPQQDALTSLIEERTDVIRIDLLRIESKVNDLN